MSDPTTIIASLIGHQHEGAGKWDCYTCAAEAMRMMGQTMPPLPIGSDGRADRDALLHFARWFDKINEPERGALIVMQLPGREIHIAVAIDATRMIHCRKATGTVVQRIEMMRPVITGIFRLRLSPIENAVPAAFALVDRPAGVELGTALVYALVATALSVAVSYAINAIFPPSSPKGSGSESSSIYSWSGIKNSRTQGTPIAAIYGEHRIGGQIIQLYRKNRTDDSLKQNLYMLIALGYGPIDRIGSYTSDMDALGPRGSLTDDFSASMSDLQDSSMNHPPWFRRWGAAGGIASTGTVASKGAISAGYTMRDDVGLDNDNWYVEGKFVTVAAGGSFIGLAGNIIDIDNYHAVIAEPDGVGGHRLKIIKRVAGVQTTLYTGANGSYTLTTLVGLWRYSDVLHLEVGGTEITTVDADGAITSTARCGLVAVGASAATVDDWKMRCAKYLPTGMQINGITANAFRNVKAWTRLGREKQPSLPSAFQKIIMAHSPDVLIGEEWTEYQVRDELTGFHLNIDFPRGLYDQTGASLATKSVVLKVEYRENDAGSWAAITGSPFTITEKETQAFTRTITYEPGTPLSGTDQQIRIRRVSAAVALTGESRVADECRLADVNEVLGTITNPAYANIALVGLEIQATDQLNTTLPTATQLVRGLWVPTWNGSAGSATNPNLVMKYSQNPAWVIADMLLNTDRGLGNFIGVADVDWASFAAFAAWCDETVTYREAEVEPAFTTNNTEATFAGLATVVIDDTTDAGEFAAGDFVRVEYEAVNRVVSKIDLGGGRYQLTLVHPHAESYGAAFTLSLLTMGAEIDDTRHLFNGAFEQANQSAWEAIKQVCMMSRAVPMKQGNRIRLRYEAAADPVQLFTDANILKDTLSITYLAKASHVDLLEVQFLNADRNYDQDIATAGGLPVSDPNHAALRETVNLYGITNLRQAAREANYQLRARRLINSKCSFQVAMDGLSAEPGDVISIASVMPDWSFWTGRASGTLASFKLSQPIVLAAGVTYKALIRTAALPAGALVTITSAAGTYAAGATITSDGGSSAIDEAALSIGPTTTLSTDWRIVQVRISDRMTIELECLRYVPEIYDLIGWTLGDIEPPAGCLTEGLQYLIPYAELCRPPDPGAGSETGNTEGVQCEIVNFQVTVNVTGDAAGCVTVISAAENGVIVSIAPGCSGDEFCLVYSGSYSWLCCLPGPIPDCYNAGSCTFGGTVCKTIC